MKSTGIFFKIQLKLRIDYGNEEEFKDMKKCLGIELLGKGSARKNVKYSLLTNGRVEGFIGRGGFFWAVMVAGAELSLLALAL